MLVRKAKINKVDFDLLCMYEYDTHVGLNFKRPPLSKLLHNIEYQALYIMNIKLSVRKIFDRMWLFSTWIIWN